MKQTEPSDTLSEPGTYLAALRTTLGFQRTRMALDRTQMAVLRTSLSMIGFGFTIYKFFEQMGKSLGASATFGPPALNFGLTLVILGVALLAAGIVNHYRALRVLRQQREELYRSGLLEQGPSYTTSPNMIISILLLLMGLLITLGLLARLGPFG